MEAKELMLNDKVYLRLDNGKKVKCEVKGLSGNRVFFEPLEEAELYGNEDSEEHFEPIPLTPEILERHGFKQIVDGEPYYGCPGGIWQNDNALCGVDYNKGGEFYTFSINPEESNLLNNICGIYNVHELQRALKCCGLWDIANDFKV